MRSYNNEPGDRAMRYHPEEVAAEVDQPPAQKDLLDFYAENESLFKDSRTQDPALDANTWSQYEVLSSRKKRNPRSDDRY